MQVEQGLQEQQRRIDWENLRLMKRLGETSSVYPLNQFITSQKDHKQYIKTRCVHPHSLFLKPNKAELIHSCSREFEELQVRGVQEVNVSFRQVSLHQSHL
jgi:hypothetical protein